MKHKTYRWHDMKLQSKFVLIFLIVALSISGVSLYTFQTIRDAYTGELYDKSVQLMVMFADNVQNDLERIIFDSENILGDKVLQENLSEIANSDSNAITYFLSQNISERLLELHMLSTDIKQICLVDINGTQYGRFDEDYKIEEKYLKEIVAMARAAEGREVWVYIPEVTDHLILARDIREVRNLSLNSLGTLVISVRFDYIVNRTSRVLANAGMEPMVAIYHNGEGLYVDDVLEGVSIPKEYSVYDSDQGMFFCSSYSFPRTGWEYVTAIPYESIFHAVSNALTVSLFVFLGAIAFVIVLGTSTTSAIIKHIEKLILLCDAFGRGEYVANGDIYNRYRNRKDEIGKLYRHFDHMASENDKMIQEIYVKQQLLLETQVSNLRAQIRPHFLYNTLESIYCLAVTCEDSRIGAMTSSLGKFLRMTLKEQRSLVTIREDMEVAAAYLKIQSIRLGDRLRTNIHIDEQYADVMIPSMSIQPIVENAILHGVENMLETCTVSVYCQERDGFVELVVENNGSSIDEDIIQKLERKEILPKGLGIGLTNIQKRLKFLLSEDCCILIERKGENSLVIIRLLGNQH